MEILDNFLPYEEFSELERYFMDGMLTWKYQPHKVMCGLNHMDVDNYQFIHPFYLQGVFDGNFIHEISPEFQSILPLINKLDFIALHRVKANLEPLKSKRFYSDFHYDWADMKTSIPSATMTTAIYYVNTCDGFTEFGDGTVTEAVANRLVKFPANTKHRGVSQLDNRFKCVINFNFFEK